jgi:hypothetical protein
MGWILICICLGQHALYQTNLHDIWYIKWSHVIFQKCWGKHECTVHTMTIWVIYGGAVWYVLNPEDGHTMFLWMPLSTRLHNVIIWMNNIFHCSGKRTWSQKIINHAMQTFNYAGTKLTLVFAWGFISSLSALLWRLITWMLFGLVLIFFGLHIFQRLALSYITAADNFLCLIILANHVVVFVDILCPEDRGRRLLWNNSDCSQINMASYPWWL